MLVISKFPVRHLASQTGMISCIANIIGHVFIAFVFQISEAMEVSQQLCTAAASGRCST